MRITHLLFISLRMVCQHPIGPNIFILETKKIRASYDLHVFVVSSELFGDIAVNLSVVTDN